MTQHSISRRVLLTTASAALVLAGTSTGWSQSYPSGAVKLIVPYAPNGSADIFGRTVATELAKKINQPVQVENQPGGGGGVGLQALGQASPDGRTLLLGQTGEIVVQPFFMRQAGARPLPVSLVAVTPLAVVVPVAAPYAKLQDLIAAARSAPRGLSVASPGRLTPGDLAIELFRNKTGSRLASVPFDGGGPALNAVASGTVDIYFSTLASTMPYLRAGKVKVLAVTSAERSPALPDVPTVQESGVRRFAVTQWAGVFVPRGTPSDVVAKLNADINGILSQPGVSNRITQDGGKVTLLSADQFADFIKADGKVYQELLTAELCAEFVVESCSGGGAFSQ